VGHEDGLGLDGDVVLDGEVVDLFWAGSVGFGRAREREKRREKNLKKREKRRAKKLKKREKRERGKRSSIL
jgi:hypothetical protein